MTHSLRTAALAIAGACIGTCFAAGAAEACLFAPTPTYTTGYHPGYYTASYAPSYGSYVSTSYYGFASYGSAYGSACCTPSCSYYVPACDPCGDPCGGCGVACNPCNPCNPCDPCDPCGGCGVGGCAVGGCGIGGCAPAAPTPPGPPTPAGGPVPRDPGDYPTPAAPGGAPGGTPPRTFIEEPLPQDTQPRDDSGFGPLRDGSDYDSDRRAPGSQPDGFAPKQPTFEEPGGDGTFGGDYGDYGGGTDTRLRLPSFRPWRSDSDAERQSDGEPVPRDVRKTDSVRGRRPAPALNLDDKIARRPAPQRTRLTDRGESSASWLPVARAERRSVPASANAGWLPNDAPTQLVRK